LPTLCVHSQPGLYINLAGRKEWGTQSVVGVDKNICQFSLKLPEAAWASQTFSRSFDSPSHRPSLGFRSGLGRFKGGSIFAMGPHLPWVPHPLRPLRSPDFVFLTADAKGGFRSSVDLDGPLFSQRVIAVTAPSPLLRRRDQSALHRIPVHIVQFLNDLFLREYVEVIRSGQPECWRKIVIRRARAAPGKALPRHPLLQDLYSYRNISIVGLANEQMEILRHDHVADHREFSRSG
jgi:hypothetical protein